MPFYYLELMSGPEKGRRYPLPDGAISIGRNSQNAISLPSAEKSVSGHHAIVYKSPQRILLQDLQSTNGTLVNESKIKEQDLAVGDEIGFGKNGPRLKLIVSETELPTDPSASAPPLSSKITTNLQTIEDITATPFQPYPSSSTAREDQNAITRMKLAAGPHRESGQAKPSVTMEMEQKILSKKIGSSDMRKLIKNGERIEKIIDRGNVDGLQANMLRSMHGARQKSQRGWFVVVGVILLISIVVSGYFAIRAFQYRALLNHAKSLTSQIDTYEKKIAEANANPDQNRETLKSLINELDQKNGQLTTMKSKINQDDFGAVYGDPLERTIGDIVGRFGETDYHIPPEMTSRVKYYLELYSGNMHGVIANYLIRKEKYLPMILRILRERRLPEGLAYVAMNESGFNPNALSTAGARGLWQFMPKTGQTYGLRVDDQVDERLDAEKSTQAASQYFKDLIGIFGGKSSVMLVMAAYNAGEGRLIGALRKIDDPMRNRDFWYIYHMGYLAEETNEYIPRVIAMTIIAENPKKYGFAGSSIAPTAGNLESEKDFVEVGKKGAE